MTWKERCTVWVVFGVVAYVFWGDGLSFTFWKDDWNYLWNALYRPEDLFAISSLHPGTTAEFLFLGTLFGVHPLPWQLAGIVLRVLAGIGVMDMAAVLSGSVMTGTIAGFLFIVMPQGLESVVWVSAHVSNLAVFLFTEGVAAYPYTVPQDRRRRVAAYLYWIAAFVADPLRILPLVWVPIVFAGGTLRSIRVHLGRTSVRLAVIVASGIGSVAVWPFLRIWAGDRWQLVMSHPIRIGLLGNFGQNMWNLLTGFLYRSGHTVIEISHGSPERAAGIAGITVCLGMIMCLFANRRVMRTGMNRFLGVSAFWIIATLGIQWMAEPRLVLSTAHRYLVMPGVGLVMLIAGGIGLLPVRVRTVAVVSITLAAWITGRGIMGQMHVFRNERVVTRIWKTIDMTITSRDVPPIIVIMGEDPMKSNTADFGAAGHFMLTRKESGLTQTAVFTTDSDEIGKIVCGQVMKYRIGDIYAFSVLASGAARDDSESFRIRLRTRADVSRCLSVPPTEEVKSSGI